MITSAVPGACQTRGHIQVRWVARRPRPDVDLHRGAPRARRSGAGRLARPQSWGVGVEPQRLHGTGAGKGASGRATDSLKRQILCRAKPKRGFRPCDPRGRRCQRRWHAEGSPQVGASFSSENGPGTRGVRDTAPRRRRPGVRRAVQVNRSGPCTRGVGRCPGRGARFPQRLDAPAQMAPPAARCPRGPTRLRSSRVICWAAPWRDRDKGDLGTVRRERRAGWKQWTRSVRG